VCREASRVHQARNEKALQFTVCELEPFLISVKRGPGRHL
jgi:hypothetical protein